MPAFFSAAWADAVCARLNASASYREAAASWEGDIAFTATADGDAPERTVWLDLHRGACRGAAGGLDGRSPAFTITATPAVWRDVLSGKTDPVMGMMLGKLKVDGSMSTIAANARAAKALVAEAAAVPIDG